MSETVILNSPPLLGPPEEEVKEDVRANPSMAEVAAVNASTLSTPPVLQEFGPLGVELPGGYINLNNELVTSATVRELNGFDEERMSRTDRDKNGAVYITELLSLAVEELDGSKPSKDVIRKLLIGDRDALVLGIRKASYGSHLQFKLTCDACGNESDVDIDIDEDVPVKKLEDPHIRTYDVELRDGMASVALLNGAAAEAFSENITKRTTAEVNSIMLAKSVFSINGINTFGSEDAVRALSSADRATLVQFIWDKQPGPQFQAIPVLCATCGEEYPITLGLSDLFRI